MTIRPIKQCPMCGSGFSLEDFLTNEELVPIGMMFEDDDPTSNAMFFQHTADYCGTSLAIPAELLLSLISEAVPTEILAGTEKCEHHCFTPGDNAECNQVCRYAPSRRLMTSMLNRRTVSGVSW